MSISTQTGLAELAAIDQGTVSDAMVRLGIGAWTTGLHPVNDQTAVFAGRARTLLIGPRRPGRSPALSKYAVIAALSPGDALVIGGSPGDENLLGDNVGRFAELHGLAAIVTTSLARDAVRLRELHMPVFTRGRSAQMPAATAIVDVDVPVPCGGAIVCPGDIVVGGVDGLCVIPAARLEDVIAEAVELAHIEILLREAIEAGAPLKEIERLGASKLVPRLGSGSAGQPKG
jgi:4-hydroxy-4-methyl-2-oxoglutarate aldolase